MTGYLSISGPHTSLRLSTPRFGALRIGSNPECDICLSEDGIAPRHVELYLGNPINALIIGPDVALIGANKDLETPIAPNTSCELRSQDRLRIGAIEIHHTPKKHEDTAIHLLDPNELRYELSRIDLKGVLVRLVGEPNLIHQIQSQLNSEDILTRLEDDELAIILVDASLQDAHTFLNQVSPSASGIALIAPGQAQKTIDSATPRNRPHRHQSRRIVSDEPAMLEVEQLLDQASKGDEPILIIGETGTGKDRLVEELHQRSSRRHGPLVRIAAIDISDHGISSDTIQRASGGTLVIDEVSALDPKTQLTLARDLEHGRLIHTRVVATSNQSVEQLVAQASFRKDLFFRLARFRLELPPLRERPQDIAALTSAFVSEKGVPPLSPDLLELFKSYPWPGNIRELESVISRAVLASGGQEINRVHLPSELIHNSGELRSSVRAQDPAEVTLGASQNPQDRNQETLSLRDEIAALEHRRILEALEHYPTQTEAAKALGIPLRTFLNRMDSLGIPRARKKS